MKLPPEPNEIVPSSSNALDANTDANARAESSTRSRGETLGTRENSSPRDSSRRDLAARDETINSNVNARRNRAADALLTGQRWRRAARWIGMFIFLIGALLIAWVFLQAKANFEHFGDAGYIQFQVNKITGDPISQQITAYISVLGGEVLRFLYLLLLGVLGSFIAGKGIQFFAASESVIDEAVDSVVPYEN